MNNPVRYTDPSGHMFDDGDTEGGIDLKTYLLEKYHWHTDNAFTYGELTEITQAARDIETHIQSHGGNGQKWIRTYLGNTRFHKEARIFGIDINKMIGAGAFVAPRNDIWFQPGSMNVTAITHECGHIFDNYFGPRIIGSAIVGGGAADWLINYLGGTPSGIRFLSPLDGVIYDSYPLPRDPNDLPDEDNYGMSSSAEYWAQHFVYQIYGYPENHKDAATTYVEIFISVSINLLP